MTVTGCMTNYMMHYSILHDLLHGITWNYMPMLERKIAGRVQKECCWKNAWPSLSVCFACLVIPPLIQAIIAFHHELSVPHWIGIPPSFIPQGFLSQYRIKGSNHPCRGPRANFFIQQADWVPTRKQKLGITFDKNGNMKKNSCKIHVISCTNTCNLHVMYWKSM